MSKLTLQDCLTTPATPPAGFVSIYQESGVVKAIDSSGVITTLVTTTEDIQDTVASLLAEGNGLTITYDDAGNILNIAVNQSELDHTLLQNLSLIHI